MLRGATSTDIPQLVELSQALNAHESIEITREELAAGLAELIGQPRLGVVFCIAEAGDRDTLVGYGLCAYSFDLEFRGTEAWLTEFYVVPDARGRGLGDAALTEMTAALAAKGVKALHLQVRADNPAVALYARHGFTRVPRLVMTRKL